jgi:hypothetical protein
MGCKSLGCFGFSKSLFLIFKNNVQIFNILFYFYGLFSKIKKIDSEKLKHPKFLYPIRFQYEEFNEEKGSNYHFFGAHGVYLFIYI